MEDETPIPPDPNPPETESAGEESLETPVETPLVPTPGWKSKKVIIGVVAAVVVVIVGALIFWGLRGGSEDVVKEEEVSIQTEEEVRPLYIVTLLWEPYAYEESGEYKGLAYDVMDMALNNLGLEYDFELVPWSRALKMAETGDADAVSLITHKEDREAYMDYTTEQYAYGLDGVTPEAYLVKVDYVFFLRSVYANRLKVESLEQLARDDYRIGINQDYSYSAMINAANLNTISYVNEADGLGALERGEVDLFIANTEVGLAILSDRGLLEDITYIDTPIDVSYLFLTFSKNSDYPNLEDLQKVVDKELIKIYESGEYDKIRDKYVKE